MRTHNVAIRRYIDRHGVQEASKRLGVSIPALYAWANGTRRISGDRAVELERASGGELTRDDLRPDLYTGYLPAA